MPLVGRVDLVWFADANRMFMKIKWDAPISPREQRPGHGRSPADDLFQQQDARRITVIIPHDQDVGL
jgi:hypothetical protein